MKTAVLASLCLVVVLATSVCADRDPQEFSKKMDELDEAVRLTVERWGKTTKRCVGDNDCCTSTNKCGLGEGDCDRDSDCLGPAVCGARGNCKEGVKVPTYENWEVDVETDFSSTDSCCQLDQDLIDYLEKEQE